MNIRKVIKKTILNVIQESEEIRLNFNIELPEDIQKINNIFKKNGYKLFVVGGAVRDALLGKNPKDFDVSTDAVPDEVERMLRGTYKTLPTGKAFGVINVFTPTGDFEIATFRRDLYQETPDLEGFKKYLQTTDMIKYQKFMKLIMK